MASKYRKKFELPADFYEILENYSREVLRDQPLDIIEFSYLYFKALEEVSCHTLLQLFAKQCLRGIDLSRRRTVMALDQTFERFRKLYRIDDQLSFASFVTDKNFAGFIGNDRPIRLSEEGQEHSAIEA